MVSLAVDVRDVVVVPPDAFSLQVTAEKCAAEPRITVLDVFMNSRDLHFAS